MILLYLKRGPINIKNSNKHKSKTRHLIIQPSQTTQQLTDLINPKNSISLTTLMTLSNLNQLMHQCCPKKHKIVPNSMTFNRGILLKITKTKKILKRIKPPRNYWMISMDLLIMLQKKWVNRLYLKNNSIIFKILMDLLTMPLKKWHNLWYLKNKKNHLMIWMDSQTMPHKKWTNQWSPTNKTSRTSNPILSAIEKIKKTNQKINKSKMI